MDPVDAVLARRRAEDLRAAVDRRDAGAALRALDRIPDASSVFRSAIALDVLARILAAWDAGEACDNILTPDLVHELRVIVQRSSERCAFVYTSAEEGGTPCPFTRAQHPLLHPWFDR